MKLLTQRTASRIAAGLFALLLSSGKSGAGTEPVSVGALGIDDEGAEATGTATTITAVSFGCVEALTSGRLVAATSA